MTVTKQFTDQFGEVCFIHRAGVLSVEAYRPASGPPKTMIGLTSGRTVTVLGGPREVNDHIFAGIAMPPDVAGWGRPSPEHTWDALAMKWVKPSTTGPAINTSGAGA